MSQGVRDEVGYIAPIEGLRGVAVLWVMAFHYFVVRAQAFPQDPWIVAVFAWDPLHVVVGNGYLGVDLFFLITGFLLTLQWFRHASEGRPAPAAREFYRRRAYRILPAYYVQLLFLFFICVPLLRDLTHWKTDLAYYLANLSAHVMMLHYTSPLTSSSVGLNGALWTLALETQYYLLLPLLAPLFVRAPRASALLLLGLAMAWRWLSLHDLKPVVEMYTAMSAIWNTPEAKIRHLLLTQLPGYLGHFAVGILCGHAWLRRRLDTPGRAANVLWLAAALAGLGVLYNMHTPDGVRLGEYTWVLIPLSMGLAMMALVSSGIAAAHPLLANRPLLLTGRISYSIYLYHVPLLLLWNRFAPKELGWFSLPLYGAIVFAVAYASWRFVEVPYLKHRDAAERV